MSLDLSLRMGAGSSALSLSTTSKNNATARPQNLTPPQISGSPLLVGVTLSVAPGVWSNAASLSHHWLRNGNAIPGATGTSYTTTEADEDCVISCRETAVGPTGIISLPVHSNTLTPASVDPVNTTPPVINGSLVAGDPLVCTTGAWTNSPVTYIFQWRVDTANVIGANDSTFIPPTSSIGKLVDCRVTALRPNGSGEVITVAVLITGSTAAPANVTPPTIIGAPAQGEILALDLGEWINAPTSFNKQWKRNGAAIPGEIGLTYATVLADLGQIITCDVEAVNGVGSSAPIATAPLSILAPYYVGPNQAGAADGSSWANCAAFSSSSTMNAAINAARTQSKYVAVAAHLGNYTAGGTITAGGQAGAPVWIRGCAENLSPANAPFVGSRTSPWTMNGSVGNSFFLLGNGADHLRFKNLAVSRAQYGFRIQNPVDDLHITDCVFTNVERGIENLLSGTTFTHASVTNFLFARIVGRGFTRDFIRVRYASQFGVIEDIDADGMFYEHPSFWSSGLVLLETASDIDVVNCWMRNGRDSPTKDGATIYHNGDGYAQEVGNQRIRYIDCKASGWSDGGWDCKGGMTLIRRKAWSNKRNFRAWDHRLLTGCIGRDPINRYDYTAPLQVYVASTSTIDLVNCSFVDTDESAPKADGAFLLGDSTAHLTVTNTSVQKHPGTPYAELDTTDAPPPPENYTAEIAAGPVCTVNPTITGSFTDGGVLTFHPGVYDQTIVSRERQWKRNNLPIDGAVGLTYTNTPADIGAVITCAEYAMSAAGHEGGKQAVGAVVSAVIPTNVSPPLVFGYAFVGSTLTTTTGAWNFNPTGFAIAWLADDVPIPGETSASLLVTPDLFGKTIKSRVSASNSAGTSAPATSAGHGPITNPTTVTIYVAPDALGDGSGSSAANAAPVGSPSQLASFINGAPAGSTIVMLADQGVYNYTTTVNLTAGGTSGAPVTIRGEDSSGNPAHAIIRSNRTPFTEPTQWEVYTDIRTWTVGSRIFSFNSTSASYLTFEYLRFERCGDGCFYFNANVHDIVIRQMVVKNVRRFVEQHGTESTQRTVYNVTIEDCVVHGFSENAVRVRGSSYGWSITRVVADSMRQDGDNFCMCFLCDEDAHHVTFTSCEAYRAHDQVLHTSTTYWNGDGFTANSGNHHLTFIDCISAGHTDRGFDLKGWGHVMTGCQSRDNKRNLAFWGPSRGRDTGLPMDGITVTDCLFENPILRGGSGGTTNIGLYGGTSNPPYFARMKLTDSVLSRPSGSQVTMDNEANSSIFLKSVTFTGASGPTASGSVIYYNAADVTPPVLNGPTSYAVEDGAGVLLTFSANEPVMWDAAGDAGAWMNRHQLRVAALTYVPGGDNIRNWTIKGRDAGENEGTFNVAVTVQPPRWHFGNLGSKLIARYDPYLYGDGNVSLYGGSSGSGVKVSNFDADNAAISFNGSSNRYDIGVRTQGSQEFWGLVDVTSGVLLKIGNNGDRYIEVRKVSGKMAVICRDATTTYQVLSAADWTGVCLIGAIWSPTQITVHLNGVEASAACNLVIANYRGRLGSTVSEATWLTGLIGDAVHTYALTADERLRVAARLANSINRPDLAPGNPYLSGTSDTTPDAFSFTDQTGVAVSSVCVSNAIAVSGINAPAAISVVGGEYRVNGGSWTATAGTVANGDVVEVRHTSAATTSATTNTILTIGGVSDTFSSTTTAVDTTPDAFSFTDVTDAIGSTAYISNAITVAGINAAAAISVTGGEYRKNGGTWTSVAGTVVAGDTVDLRVTSAPGVGGVASATLNIGGVTDTYSVTTATAADTTPDAFSFTDASNVRPGAVSTSNAITVSGINTAAPVSITGGEYRKNGGAWTTENATAVNGDTFEVRGTAATAYLGTTNVALIIGGGSDTYTITTRADPFISALGNGGTSVTFTQPPQAGDLILVFAFRGDAGSSPGSISGYTNISNGGANSVGHRFACKIADGTETATPVSSNATRVHYQIWRGVSLGVAGQASANSNQIGFADLMPQVGDGSSHFVGFAGHRTATDLSTQVPAGMTNVSSHAFSASHKSGPLADWSTQTVTVNQTNGWRAVTAELKLA